MKAWTPRKVHKERGLPFILQGKQRTGAETLIEERGIAGDPQTLGGKLHELCEVIRESSIDDSCETFSRLADSDIHLGNLAM